MNEYDLGHVMLSLWYPTLAVRYYFFTENVSILMSFVKEDADVDYISLDLHLIKCTLISGWCRRDFAFFLCICVSLCVLCAGFFIFSDCVQSQPGLQRC